MSCEAESKTPSKEWYGGIASPGKGILRVFIGTSAFNALHPDLYDQMNTWGHSQLGRGRTEFPSPETAQLHREAGIFVHKVTGFDPEVLMDYKKKLERIYRNQPTGPFPFPVTWIE